jgi:hypothetical protein
MCEMCTRVGLDTRLVWRNVAVADALAIRLRRDQIMMRYDDEEE